MPAVFNFLCIACNSVHRVSVLHEAIFCAVYNWLKPLHISSTAFDRLNAQAQRDKAYSCPAGITEEAKSLRYSSASVCSRLASEKSAVSKQSNKRSMPCSAFSASVFTRTNSQSLPKSSLQLSSRSFCAHSLAAEVKTEAENPPVICAIFAAACAQSIPLKPIFVRACA